MEPNPGAASTSVAGRNLRDNGQGMSTRETVLRYEGDRCELASDEVTVEEPLQIRLAGEDVAVTMRTPGHDEELAAGFLYTEGIIGGKHHIEEIAYCVDSDGSLAYNILNVSPTDRDLLEPRHWGRNFYSNSSCGLCGKTSIEQVASRQSPVVSSSGSKVTLEVLYSLPGKLREAQATFSQTGGIHAAALFDIGGNLIVIREDVGRHNAVDKVVGHALLNNMLPLDNHILLVSSRASFEIVQKAAVAGVRVLAVISAPSSLSIQLAREAGMTLVAFLRERRLNVYSGEERIEP